MNRYKKIYDELHAEALALKKEHQKLSPEKSEMLKEADENYYLLKKFEWVLFTGRVLDENDKKKFNRKLGRYLNLSDIYNMIMNIDPILCEAVELKERISRFYKKETYETAKKELEAIIIEFRRCPAKDMSGFADTLVRWKNEIINSFIIIPSINRKMNTALSESRNKTIKLLKHSSNGYLCWKRFRNRVLYCINNDVAYRLENSKKKENDNDERKE